MDFRYVELSKGPVLHVSIDKGKNRYFKKVDNAQRRDIPRLSFWIMCSSTSPQYSLREHERSVRDMQ